MKKLRLNVGTTLSCDDLLDALRESDELSAFLASDIEARDPLATIDDCVIITEIEKLSEGQYLISYEYEWSADYRCRDVFKSDTYFSDIRLTYEDGVVEFEMVEIDIRTMLE